MTPGFLAAFLLGGLAASAVIYVLTCHLQRKPLERKAPAPRYSLRTPPMPASIARMNALCDEAHRQSDAFREFASLWIQGEHEAALEALEGCWKSETRRVH